MSMRRVGLEADQRFKFRMGRDNGIEKVLRNAKAELERIWSPYNGVGSRDRLGRLRNGKVLPTDMFHKGRNPHSGTCQLMKMGGRSVWALWVKDCNWKDWLAIGTDNEILQTRSASLLEMLILDRSYDSFVAPIQFTLVNLDGVNLYNISINGRPVGVNEAGELVLELPDAGVSKPWQIISSDGTYHVQDQRRFWKVVLEGATDFVRTHKVGQSILAPLTGERAACCSGFPSCCDPIQITPSAE
ncbi:hypothetical protein HD554DRAFT_2042277 [Boletus coccyginus]|nr:hypothetical protein HD554DRAFT_2042277 [Boletus coccyginus]